MTTKLINYQNVLCKDQLKNIYIPAIEEITAVLTNFLDECTFSKTENKYYVCSSFPGHGKTTALQAVVKSLMTQKYKIPLLLVFLNNDNMRTFYKSIDDFAKMKNINNAIVHVDSDNVDDVLDDLTNHQIVCITQQRFRDLAIEVSDPDEYMWYKLQNGLNIKRNIIIDEAPIFMSQCGFDLGTNDNQVDWFDALASESELSEEDKRFTRKRITEIINVELDEDFPVTKRLNRHIKESSDLERLDAILDCLTTRNAESEHIAKFAWFKKLLHQDDVAVIDRHDRGSTILCARRIDYRELGNILILDGTSNITKRLYNNEYQYIHTKNYHDYQSRLHLNLHEINTSSNAKKDKEKKTEIFQLIADDLEAIRSSEINPFPLVKKDEINICIRKGIITKDQIDLYDQNNVDELPLNLLNTTGKNKLNTYDALALLNIPFRHASVYKKTAISLYGTNIDLSMNKGRSKNWFVDERVQAVFDELVLADLIQIIHRCSIRNINSNSKVNIYLYTKRKEWLDTLQLAFGLPESNVHKSVLHDLPLEKFTEKCNEWAVKAKEFAQKYFDDDLLFNTPTYTAYDIGGKPFKDWFNRNWKKQERQKIISECFFEHDLQIETNEKGYKSIYIVSVA
jgi:hypothetical protein